MARRIAQGQRARATLAIDAKTNDGLWMAPLPERVPAWDEDATTLAIAAADGLPRADAVFVSPAIDREAFQIALDLGAPPVGASDPLAAAKAARGRSWAVASPDLGSSIALLVEDGDAPDAAPADRASKPRLVSAARALQESRRIPPVEAFSTSPMGAYVPWGTWLEDLPARLRLVAQRCTSCARTLYPPRAACPACRGRDFAPVPLPREARIYALTRIGRGGAPSEFALEQEQVGAYWVAVVEWPEEGVRVSARLADFDDEGPAIGAPVRATVRRLFEQEGRTRYGVKFGPL